MSQPVGHGAAKGLARTPPPTSVAPPPAPDDPNAARILGLQATLKDLLKEKPLSRSRVGVEVVSAHKGQVIFSYNANRLFDPASNEKILTTTTALETLGPEFRYRTSLSGKAPDDDGVVSGDLFLRGTGDPLLGAHDLADLARKLAQKGVKRITGGIVAEERRSDPRGVPVDTSDGHDDLGFTPISLNRNTFAVVVRPAESAGQPPEVSVEPQSSYFAVINHAKTSPSGRSRIRVDTYRQGNTTAVSVTGRIPIAHWPVRVRRRPLQPGLFAAATLIQVLRDMGVEVTGEARAGVVPTDVVELAQHLSQPLAIIIRTSNKESNNYVAERIFQTVGAEMYGAPASTSKGQKAIAEFLEKIGLTPGTYHATNGSGLAHTNRITPDALVTLLRRVYYDIAVAPDFLQSLAVGGIDGTIRRRFAGTESVGLVRAKTGTLNGVSALSGYVGHKDDVIVFSILVEKFGGRKLGEVRLAQVRMVNAMMRFLRGAADQGGLPAPSPEMDVESTTDETVDVPQDPEPAATPKAPGTPAAPTPPTAPTPAATPKK